MAKKEKVELVRIDPPNFAIVSLKLKGISPYMQARFSHKTQLAIQEKHMAGSQAKKGKKRPKRDFDDEFEESKHKFADGSCGIPASCFRKAAISACRLVGFKMTLAKLSIFALADEMDAFGLEPLVRIKGDCEKVIIPVRNATGVLDLRSRPVWKKWSATIKIKFDLDQFSVADIVNLFNRVGQQVGIGEGRPDSKSSAGLGGEGYGKFIVEEVEGESQQAA